VGFLGYWMEALHSFVVAKMLHELARQIRPRKKRMLRKSQGRNERRKEVRETT